MITWERTLTGRTATLREALSIIDATGTGIALIVDESRRLQGTLSDGDIRRALIQGASLDSPAATYLNPNPKLASASESRLAILAKLRALGLRQLPIVDEYRVVVGLATVDDFLRMPDRPHWVVIMAGGRGERLSELTQHTPKPMLRVGPRPILDTIVTNYAVQGFKNFFLSVNYKAEQIEEYFGDGESRGLNIRYLREKSCLGTGGALSLLPERPPGPIMVCNGDVLSKEDHGAVLDSHLESGADATVLVRNYDIQIPFGVITQDERGISSIEEKPTRRCTINAGVYVLSPPALDLVPRDTFFDLPTLLTKMLDCGMHVRSYRADSYWMDIGRMPDYEQANADFGLIFE